MDLLRKHAIEAALCTSAPPFVPYHLGAKVIVLTLVSMCNAIKVLRSVIMIIIAKSPVIDSEAKFSYCSTKHRWISINKQL
jgi:hypothetical protein